jgi:hypothetical protein
MHVTCHRPLIASYECGVITCKYIAWLIELHVVQEDDSIDEEEEEEGSEPVDGSAMEET